jgi:hypothetical protein
MTLQYID